MAGIAINRLVQGLCQPEAYPHPTGDIRTIETHISLVFLTGDFAYKIKKPVDFGFINYTTLKRRKHFCEEEVRLNRRLAPTMYLDVVPVTGDADHPRISTPDTSEEAFEYAVKMVEFPQKNQWDKRLERGELRGADIDRLADLMERFHAQAFVAGPADGYGGPEQVRAAAMGNFELTEQFVPDLIDPDRYRFLREWNEAFLTGNQSLVKDRLEGGFVRECHGDAHLRNVATIEGERTDQIAVFDCIEFNPVLRFTDVMAEIAFTVMDLEYRRHPELANRFLNRYLESGGDYAGLAVLPLYLSYRAYVRAKVAALGPDSPDRQDSIDRHLALAEGYCRRRSMGLILMHGVTGTGKTTVSGHLAETLGAVRIRSDVERKRLAGVGRGDAAAAVGEGIYDAASTERTYTRLTELAETALSAGFTVILDATYLSRARRARACAVAEAAGLPWVVVDCSAPRETLVTRIEKRAREATDLSDGTVQVLDVQLASREPLSTEERSRVVRVDELSPGQVAEAVRSALSGRAISGGKA